MDLVNQPILSNKIKTVAFFVLLFICITATTNAIAGRCAPDATQPEPTIIGSIVNQDNKPQIGIHAEISLPGQNNLRVKTNEKGCFQTTVKSTKPILPLSLDIKRTPASSTLVRAVERCRFNSNNVCELKPINIVSPNIVYLLPFEGDDEGSQVFASRHFRSALSKRFISNLQELEGEKVIRKLKNKSKSGKFVKLKPPGLKLFKTDNSEDFDVSDFDKIEKLGADLNALALISGATSLDDDSHTLDMSSFFLVPHETTWSLDDQLDSRKLKNMIVLARKLNPRWTYYTMVAIAKREFNDANASPNRKNDLKRVKAYLQAQRNQLDSRKTFKQTELLDLLCEVRKALNEQCGKLLVSME